MGAGKRICRAPTSVGLGNESGSPKDTMVGYAWHIWLHHRMLHINANRAEEGDDAETAESGRQRSDCELLDGHFVFRKSVTNKFRLAFLYVKGDKEHAFYARRKVKS